MLGKRGREVYSLVAETGSAGFATVPCEGRPRKPRQRGERGTNRRARLTQPTGCLGTVPLGSAGCGGAFTADAGWTCAAAAAAVTTCCSAGAGARWMVVGAVAGVEGVELGREATPDIFDTLVVAPGTVVT